MSIIGMNADDQMAVYSSDGRCVIFSTAQLLPKTTRNTQGVAVMTLKKKATLEKAAVLGSSGIVNASRYRSKTIPSSGAILKPEDLGQQQESFEV
jgi:DNA gyrase subunit A